MSNLMQCGIQLCLEQEIGLLGYITLSSADCYLVIAGGPSLRALLLEIPVQIQFKHTYIYVYMYIFCYNI